jgi:hypothetical protein
VFLDQGLASSLARLVRHHDRNEEVKEPLVALIPLVVAFAICLVTLGIMITSVCRTVQQVSAFAFGGLVLSSGRSAAHSSRWRYSPVGLTRRHR